MGSGNKKEMPLLDARDIECRVATIVEYDNNNVSCTLLLYKDARVDMRFLDKEFGQMNWKRTHEVIDGNLYCTISIWDESKKEWVSKQDVGTESMTEKEKGQASDSFKRAGFNWGIGRELYTAPVIWITLNASEIKHKNGKPTTNARFYVKSIRYNEQREISGLSIVDKFGKVRFSFGDSYSEEEREELEIAINDAKNAIDMPTLLDIAKNWIKFKDNERFKNVCYQRKAELKS